MTFLLGPATVALAIPLYKNRHTFLRNLVPAGAGLLAGSLGTMIAGGLIARKLGFTPELVSSITIKSATVPIAVEVAKIIHRRSGKPLLAVLLISAIDPSSRGCSGRSRLWQSGDILIGRLQKAVA